MMNLLDLVKKTIASDRAVNEQNVTKADSEKLTLKRDAHGILWSYDANGKKVGRVFEHGDDSRIDEIEEI
jgi:hypothetical protein